MLKFVREMWMHVFIIIIDKYVRAWASEWMKIYVHTCACVRACVWTRVHVSMDIYVLINLLTPVTDNTRGTSV